MPMLFMVQDLDLQILIEYCFFGIPYTNKFITLCSNLFSDLNLTDVETGYKVFKKEIIKSINIEEKRFGFEIEITHKIANYKPKT